LSRLYPSRLHRTGEKGMDFYLGIDAHRVGCVPVERSLPV
jgi:hypothetical protein